MQRLKGIKQQMDWMHGCRSGKAIKELKNYKNWVFLSYSCWCRPGKASKELKTTKK
jgi:hypothetical protein